MRQGYPSRQDGRMSSRAGTPATASDLIDVEALIHAYWHQHPDVNDPEQKVAFGTSGHRGSSLKSAFNDDHIAAITQAIVEYRAGQGVTGPLFIGADTHALSAPAQTTALQVLVANGVRVLADSDGEDTPPPRAAPPTATRRAGSRTAPTRSSRAA